MAENRTSEILPYHFEPKSVLSLTVDDSSYCSSESKMGIREQASFKERLASTSWCECAKCTAMPSGIGCQCCKGMEGVSECMTENEIYNCITEHEKFKIVCLNKDVLYAALVMMNTIRGNPLTLPLQLLSSYTCSLFILFIHYRSYRLAAYRQFIYWTRNKLGKGIQKVIPSCVVVAIRHEFPEADNVYTGLKIYQEL